MKNGLRWMYRVCLAGSLVWGGMLGPGRVLKPAAAADAQATVQRTYSVGNLPPAHVARQIYDRFGQGTKVEIFANPKLGQILVKATPAQHGQVVAWLREWIGPTWVHDEQVRLVADEQPIAPQAPAPSGIGRTDFPGGSEPTVVQLRNIGWRDFVASLKAWLGPQLIIQGDDATDNYEFSLQTGEDIVRFSIDARTNLVTMTGSPKLRSQWQDALQVLDEPAEAPGMQARFVALGSAPRDKIGQAVSLLKASQERARRDPRAAPILGPRLATPPSLQLAQVPAAQAAPQGDAGADTGGEGDGEGEGEGALGPVRLELLEGLDAIIVRGSRQDVERVIEIINQIEILSELTETQIEVYNLTHTNSEAIAALVTEVNSQVLSSRLGTVSITALVKPNALLLVGRPEGVRTTIALIEKLDTPVDASSEVRIFPLKHLPVADAQLTLSQFFAEPTGLGARVRSVADFRSNSLIVYARGSDLEIVADMLQRLDVSDIGPTSEVRVFRLKNALAEDLATVLEDTLRFDPDAQQGQGGLGAGGGFGGGAAVGAAGAAGQQTRTQSQPRSTMLSLTVIDSEGKQVLRSGLLTEVRVSADTRANSLVVAAPPEAMDLIAELIRQLDSLPSTATSIKVFTIENGDASALSQMLTTLFSQQQQGGGGAGGAQPVLQSAAGEGESSLIPLRFSVDLRTNSIIVSGNLNDLTIVEAILLRLDEDDMRRREQTVYRLQNAPAESVATAVNEFLQTQRARTLEVAPETVGVFEQIEREVIVVPELVTNSLIISATRQYYDDVVRIVKQLDERPPMVLIQVLIAEVSLGTTEELGAELGIQDSLLFDRGVVTDVVTPGFNFNNQPLGNSSSANSLATRENVGGQALSNFAVGRSNGTLGYGGLVLSASNESVSVLIRALQERRRLDVLSRPQVMTLNNQPAFVQVGSRVPRITSTQLTQFGTINNTVLENVGILLGVTPRVSPDGLVVMEIDAERSRLGPIAEGIPISINQNGDVIRSPQIETITAQTTVSARTGQTVILGGLITKETQTSERKVPYIGDIPVIGRLFRFDSFTDNRSELLIIMTPFVVRDEEDAQKLNIMESQRMNWCYADVVNTHHDFLSGIDPTAVSSNVETQVIYPDLQPTVETPGAMEVQPTPVPSGPDLQPQPTDRPLPPPTDSGANNVPAGLQPAGRQADNESNAWISVRPVSTSTTTAPAASSQQPDRTPSRQGLLPRLPWVGSRNNQK